VPVINNVCDDDAHKEGRDEKPHQELAIRPGSYDDPKTGERRNQARQQGQVESGRSNDISPEPERGQAGRDYEYQGGDFLTHQFTGQSGKATAACARCPVVSARATERIGEIINSSRERSSHARSSIFRSPSNIVSIRSAMFVG
jgi:hypothetical protein